MWREIVVIITGCLNVLCPLKMITVRQDQLDWFDGELRSATDTKFSLFKKACSSGQENEWKFYTSIKKHVRKLTIKKKRFYITNKLEENKTAPNKFWKEIQNNLSIGKLKAGNNT